jgi:hypothetical protein
MPGRSEAKTRASISPAATWIAGPLLPVRLRTGRRLAGNDE